MILAEKIMSLRKQKGLSQEELAEQLGVSRQSVSKWESASSIPDIQKIMKMSEIFQVTTDYLLRDELEDINSANIKSETSNNYIEDSDDKVTRTINLEEATTYIDLVKKVSDKIALAISLFILAPAWLLASDVLGQYLHIDGLREISGIIGYVGLLVLVTIGVCIIIIKNAALNKYSFLEKDSFKLEYGVESAISRRREPISETYSIKIAIGVALCILGIVPAAVSEVVVGDVVDLVAPIMLIMVSVGVNIFVKVGMETNSYKRILQEDEYSPKNKVISKKLGWLPGVYWLSATAIYLTYSFVTYDWQRSWIVWPIAGILFGVIYTLFATFVYKKEDNY